MTDMEVMPDEPVAERRDLGGPRGHMTRARANSARARSQHADLMNTATGTERKD